MGSCILDWSGLGFQVVQTCHVATCAQHTGDAACVVVFTSGDRATSRAPWKVMTVCAPCPAGRWKCLWREQPLDLWSGQPGKCLLKWVVISLSTNDRLPAFLRWLFSVWPLMMLHALFYSPLLLSHAACFVQEGCLFWSSGAWSFSAFGRCECHCVHVLLKCWVLKEPSLGSVLSHLLTLASSRYQGVELAELSVSFSFCF